MKACIHIVTRNEKGIVYIKIIFGKDISLKKSFLFIYLLTLFVGVVGFISSAQIT